MLYVNLVENHGKILNEILGSALNNSVADVIQSVWYQNMISILTVGIHAFGIFIYIIRL